MRSRQLFRYFPAFQETRRFITVFIRVLYWSLSWARSIQSIPPHTISPNSILILSTNLRLSFPSGLFPFGFPANNLYAFLFPYSSYMSCKSHLPWLNYSNYTWRRVQIMRLDTWKHISWNKRHLFIKFLKTLLGVSYESLITALLKFSYKNRRRHAN
jgi:hypothetical protein